MRNRDIILVGGKVALGEMLTEDQQRFWEWHQNPELLRLIVDHYAPTIEEQHAWFEKTREPDRKMFSILLVPSNTLIGHGGFVDIDRAVGSAQFRITIGDSLYWGRGYGTEATKLILRHGFGPLALRRIWLRVLPSNVRALRSYQKIGFREVGREGRQEDGGERESVRMDMHGHEARGVLKLE